MNRGLNYPSPSSSQVSCTNLLLHNSPAFYNLPGLNFPQSPPLPPFPRKPCSSPHVLPLPCGAAVNPFIGGFGCLLWHKRGLCFNDGICCNTLHSIPSQVLEGWGNGGWLVTGLVEGLGKVAERVVVEGLFGECGGLRQGRAVGGWWQGEA